ncbi:hypothetical protein F0L74_21880 [Chitinophaga agrisoli]|uniref:ABC-type transport system involved in multi-copper enzyme maturation permease subunit n=1 Tax=Chitinophaga agrisoli TaxID=2607653 RepID=A0A5B2VKT6_9BACT|nr:hypothetical protein [Chitinophaga agrisoli]KAA2238867.1 hypothetical protein F0L74_21880 [Chitinophaga agrisoli]
MFLEIFLFEIRCRIRRPAFYLYFAAIFLFTVISFAAGMLPVAEKAHINSPYLIAFWCSVMTMMMMLVSSSVMGAAIYRDIEYQTRDYYLTYPVTKAGYFWGRYLGSFTMMAVIALAILPGVWLGTVIGPLTGRTVPDQYGPNLLVYYLYPFFTLALPNLFFTASLFFGLVAITRNVKVIYFGGILLFLFYFVALFFLNHTDNVAVISIADPFGINGVRYQMMTAVSAEQNNQLIRLTGPLAINRLLWPGLGAVILLFTYLRFNFERFFSGKRDKAAIDEVVAVPNRIMPVPAISFTGGYERRTLSGLIRLELLNIMRDNYFWIIVSSGSLFLGFVFWLGERNYGAPDFPRTVTLLAIFNNTFPFFIFFIIMFYTGETLQRDRLTRYAFINDALPPPNWVLNGAKLIPLLIMSMALSLIPLVVGVVVQLSKGFMHLNMIAYAGYIAWILLPKLLLSVVFCYLIHVVINNKFAAYAVGVTLWVAFFFLDSTGTFDYHLLLYGYTPPAPISDMDGMGHMAGPVGWFNLYWLLNGGLLIIVAALFYYRGVNSSFKERLQLIPARFNRTTRIFAAVLLPLFLMVGAYIYYNISYRNNYLTKGEQEDRAVMYERTLKKYQSLSLPKVTRIKMEVDLFPDKQQAITNALVTIMNKTAQPIPAMLLDGDELSAYSITLNHQPLPYTSPLLYPRGVFNWLRPRQDTAPFRLYRFPRALAPGDSLVLQVRSAIEHNGFANGVYAVQYLHNGFFFAGGLPGLGYDEEDEISSADMRKKAGLPPKDEEEIAQDDPVGMRTLKAGATADLFRLDVTVSTAGDQTALTHGVLVKQWRRNGRNYFHYVQDRPGMYLPLGIISARFANRRDSVKLDHQVYIDVYYHPAHHDNIDRIIAAYKDGLRHFSAAYSAYPFQNIRLAESSIYASRQSSTATLDAYMENNGWNAHFTDPNQFDYVYFATTRLLAQQWWRFQVAPNATAGSLVIPEGLASYDALVMAESKYGKANMRAVLLDQQWSYLFAHRHREGTERPLIRASKWFEWSGKASVVLYGLRSLIGADSIDHALRAFRAAYAFKDQPPFAGANDLYRYLQQRVPDSLQYYLTDTWQKITVYDNRIEKATMTPMAGKHGYNLTFTVYVDKTWTNDKGKDVPAAALNDYIDIGIFGAPATGKNGQTQANVLYLKRYKFTRGAHKLTIAVKDKPVTIGIDPFAMLVDRTPGDNMKKIE